MTAPSNANTSGLDCARIVACHLPEAHCSDTVCLPITITAGDLRAVYSVLVTAASAQAAIDAEKARADRLAKALDDALIYIESLGENIERNDVDMHLDAVERPFSFSQSARSQFPELCAALQQEG